MTLSQIIKLRTNDGLAIVDFLLEVMQDRYDDFRICHRLQAARLLNTYGNEDSPNFIAENSQEPRSDRHNPRPSRPSKFDTELARVIREDTDDGRSIARFLVYVMEGELESFRPHHRMAAARELLDRGFGKSAHNNPPNSRSGEGRNPETSSLDHLHPDPAEALTPPNSRSGEGRNPETSSLGHLHPDPAEALTPPNRHSRTPTRHSRESGNPRSGSPLGNPGAGEDLTPHSSPLTPRDPLRQPTDILDTLNHLQPERFEQTVLDLLENMGYGHAHHLERSGDGGIDGIIDRDPLGTERFYFQAKRCTGPVDEPEIRHFSGSLDPHGVTRGLLITTSDFTDTARRTAGTISTGNKIIRLVDGRELAQLMLTRNIDIDATPDTPNHPPKPDKNHHTHHA